MPALPAFLSNPYLRRWSLQVLGLLLLFGLLALGIWLYYDYEVRQIEHRLDISTRSQNTS